MVNGAGLAMATMDIIQYAGGSPANFLDVGGGANQQQIENAFQILLSDPNVRAVFINIFGGILRVDTLAQGVVQAARNLDVKIPIVLRLEGTNVEDGRSWPIQALRSRLGRPCRMRPRRWSRRLHMLQPDARPSSRRAMVADEFCVRKPYLECRRARTIAR